MSDRRRAVITGLGVVSPIGSDVATFWESALAGTCGIDRISQFDTTGHSVIIAGEVDDFDPTAWCPAKGVKRLDRFTQFSLAASEQAVRDAGIEFDKEDPYRVGVIIGSGVGGISEMERQTIRLQSGGPSRVSPFLIPKLMANAASGNVAIRYQARGINFDVTTACASATHAIGEALAAIRENNADVVLTGGSEATITPVGMAGFAKMKALSTRNDDPKTASRPFDKDRDGFVVGEGAGTIILEELDHARKRGAHIYAEVVGYAATCDAYHITAPEPNGEVAAKTMELALADARVDKADLSYINTHSPGTPFGDAMECAALRNLFGERADQPPVSGLKSMIGHLLGASGALSVVAIVLAMRDGAVHPTINQFTPDPECDVDCVPNEARELDVAVALSNAFGFGGHNGTLALAKLN
ncbi:MAG: beta-ketoacyl-ACP synthase II [Planctomycetota bacterium]